MTLSTLCQTTLGPWWRKYAPSNVPSFISGTICKTSHPSHEDFEELFPRTQHETADIDKSWLLVDRHSEEPREVCPDTRGLSKAHRNANKKLNDLDDQLCSSALSFQLENTHLSSQHEDDQSDGAGGTTDTTERTE